VSKARIERKRGQWSDSETVPRDLRDIDGESLAFLGGQLAPSNLLPDGVFRPQEQQIRRGLIRTTSRLTRRRILGPVERESQLRDQWYREPNARNDRRVSRCVRERSARQLERRAPELPASRKRGTDSNEPVGTGVATRATPLQSPASTVLSRRRSLASMFITALEDAVRRGRPRRARPVTPTFLHGDRCGSSRSRRNASCARYAHTGVGCSVPASVPKPGPRTINRQPTPTNIARKNGPEIADFRPVL
jgi:hypothetical protein